MLLEEREEKKQKKKKGRRQAGFLQVYAILDPAGHLSTGRSLPHVGHKAFCPHGLRRRGVACGGRAFPEVFIEMLHGNLSRVHSVRITVRSGVNWEHRRWLQTRLLRLPGASGISLSQEIDVHVVRWLALLGSSASGTSSRNTGSRYTSEGKAARLAKTDVGCSRCCRD